MSNIKLPTIIDTHTHLYDMPDIAAALRESAAAGVSDVVALGVDIASNKRHVEILHNLGTSTTNSRSEFGPKECPHIHLALGLHPGNLTAQELEDCLPFFREQLSVCHRIVAIGEIGLDFWYKTVRQDDVKKNEQRLAFQAQLDLAREFDLPVVIHSRGTWRECLDTTVKAGIKKAVFHWYSGPVDVLKDILDAGFLISVSPALEYSAQSQEAGRYAPVDRILVETDTPVRVTDPSGERVPSTPKDVWRTFNALCALKGLEEQSTLQIVNANAQRFFNLAVSPNS